MAKILCVDDEEFLRDDISEFIESLGHETVTAHDGQSGLEAILTHNPDLVLSDFTMPNMNGGELLEQLRKTHPDCADIPFIFLSALADREDVMQGLKLGADDYLTKPIDFDMLEIKVSAALRQMNRMQEKKEQEFVRLFNELSGDQDVENSGDITQRLNETDSLSPATDLKVDVHGCVIRFHELETTENESITKQRTRIINYLSKMAVEHLSKIATSKITFHHVVDVGMLVCFLEADAHDAAKKASKVAEKLEGFYHVDKFDDIMKVLNTPAIVLRDLLTLITHPYVFSISETSFKTRQGIDNAIEEELAKSSSSEGLKKSLVSYLEDNFGHLTILNLVREDNKPVPISFFSLSEKLETGLQSRLSLLTFEEQKQTKFYLDILHLEKLNSDVKNYPNIKMVVLDVHYETISERERLVNYLVHYEKIANVFSLKHKIMLNIIDFPDDRPNWYMEKLITPFGCHISRAIVQVSHDKMANFAASNNGITAVVCDYKELDRKDVDPSVIMEAKKALVKAGKLCILRGVPMGQPLEKVQHFGFNGHAIRTI